MAYDVVDVLNKAIDINYKAIDTIESVECTFDNVYKQNIMTKVLRKGIERSIDYYSELKEETKNLELQDIDFMIYDKISFLVNEYNSRIFIPKVSDTNEYVRFVLNLVKEKHALFIDIQGRLANSEYGYDENTYNVINKVIENVKQQKESLEKICA